MSCKHVMLPEARKYKCHFCIAAAERKRIIALAREKANKLDPTGDRTHWAAVVVGMSHAKERARELRWFANELEAEDG